MRMWRGSVRAAISGASAGALGTVAMSGPMIAARELGVLPELPPHRIVDTLVERSAAGPDRGGRRILGWAAHLAFGMAAGACYGLLRRVMRPAVPDAASGVAFALSVWAVSYMGWVPALGILPPATQDRPGRPVSMILAHILFGLVLGRLAGHWDSRSR